MVLRGGRIGFQRNPLFAWKEDLGGPGADRWEREKEKRSGVGLVVGRAVWEYAGSGIPFASGGQDIGSKESATTGKLGRAGTK